VSAPARARLRSLLRAPIARALARMRSREQGETTLDRERIYVLPTASGLVLGGIDLVLLFGSLHYNLQLGFLLAFLVAAIALVGLYHTHRNLAQLTLRGQRAAHVYSGEVADFEIAIDNPLAEARHALHLRFLLPRRRREGGARGREAPLPGVTLDVPAHSVVRARIGLPTRRRGLRACPRVRVSSNFPFGLWQAWAYLQPHLEAVVYPVPEASAPPLPVAEAGDYAQAAATIAGSDDFAGVRPYQPGDRLRQVAWRLAARSEDLPVKLFESSSGAETELDFALAGPGLDTEARLSRLTRWVLQADAAGLRYCLRLPGQAIPTAAGTEHRLRCLEALARFGA